tara:strand:+ start:383 stop:556 length:174 start_codon:yes stop_codon:yes gene_type:complete
MTEYAMSIKDGNGLVFRTKARSLVEAKEYFRQLKQMDEKSFNKLFIVTEIKDNERKN